MHNQTNFPTDEQLVPLTGHTVTREQAMACFDSLDPLLRQLLNEAPLPLCPFSIASDPAPAHIVYLEALKFVWGVVKDYPMHPDYPKLISAFPHPKSKAKRIQRS